MPHSGGHLGDAEAPAYYIGSTDLDTYLPGIRAAFNDLRLATDRLLRKDDDHVLTVSTLASLAAKWLLPRLSAFQEANPGIDVRITTSTTLVDFRDGNVDAVGEPDVLQGQDGRSHRGRDI